MLNWKKLALIFAVSAAMLCGCTQSNIVTPTGDVTIPGDGQPDFVIDKDIPIDWAEVREDLREEFFDPYGFFGDYVLDLDVRYNGDTHTLAVVLPVTGDPTPEIASLYGQAVLKVVGDCIATQNFYYTTPDEEDEFDYGSFFDEHDALVQVFIYNEEGNEDAYIINDLIEAGDKRAPEPQNQ